MLKYFAFLCLLTFSLNLLAHSESEESHSVQFKKPSVYIVSPKNGDKVTSTFIIKFGLKGMSVSPAGTKKTNSGHHHLLIDGNELPDLAKPLGSQVTHFGGGQTETTVTLQPGIHTLQLILGDYLHRPHNPPVVSTLITVTVE